MRILLAVDHSRCSHAAVDAVLSEFDPAHADVHVLHVDDWPRGLAISYAFDRSSRAAEDVEAMHEAQQQRDEALVEDIERRFHAARFNTTSEIRSGDAEHEILACAASWRPDLIVVGSHGRRGLRRLALGSVSEGVLRNAACSVEIVRPPA